MRGLHCANSKCRTPLADGSGRPMSPDVVVMDVMMPRKDGVEACREIMESAPETRVVMLTASTEVDAIVGTRTVIEMWLGPWVCHGVMRQGGKDEVAP